MAKDQRRAWIQALDESDKPRSYWFYVDEDGGEWFFEAVEDGGEQWVVKQLVAEYGAERRYWSQALEDAHGFLTDQPMAPGEPGLIPITAEAFFRRWG